MTNRTRKRVGRRLRRVALPAALLVALASVEAGAQSGAQAEALLDPVIVGEPVDGTFTYCVDEGHLREMAAFEADLAERGAGRGAFVARYGDRKVAECGFAAFQNLVFLERAFAWQGYTVEGEPTDWEAWEVETAEWGLHLWVVIERGWVWRGPPI